MTQPDATAETVPKHAGQLLAMALTSEAELEADTIPGYELADEIGAGGMGTVYRARHLELDREVAVKVLRRDLAAQSMFAERFLREARAMAQLEHGNIVRLYDYGQQGELFYFAMERLRGGSLRSRIEDGSLSPEHARAVIEQLARALSFAHERGFVHRDIKPENVLFDSDGTVKLADFGLVRLTTDGISQPTLTATALSVGTPQYMAPEQLTDPKTVDARADIYSLGVVYYEMLTGRLPIGSFAPASKRARCSKATDAFIARCLAANPSDRFESADALLAAVEALGGRRRTAAASPRTLQVMIGALSVVTVVGFAGTWLMMSTIDRDVLELKEGREGAASTPSSGEEERPATAPSQPSGEAPDDAPARTSDDDAASTLAGPVAGPAPRNAVFDPTIDEISELAAVECAARFPDAVGKRVLVRFRHLASGMATSIVSSRDRKPWERCVEEFAETTPPSLVPVGSVLLYDVVIGESQQPQRVRGGSTPSSDEPDVTMVVTTEVAPTESSE